MTEPKETELEELNLKVATILGWTEIQEWHKSLNPHPDLKVNKNVYIGKNNRKELGIFIPDYTKDLTAIADAYKFLAITWSVTQYLDSAVASSDQFPKAIKAQTPAISLCKLLLEIAPELEEE